MGVADKSLAAVGRPLDVAVELFGRPGQAHVFGIQIDLGAEAAADVGRNHTHLVLGQAHHKRRQQQALDVRVLVGDIEHVFIGRAAVRADHRARLHGVGNQAVVGQVQLGHMGSGGEDCIHLALVADGPFVAMVVGSGFMQGRCLGGIGDADHGAQHLVIHLDQLGGVFRLLQRFGHHHGDMVAHITHLALGQDGVRRLFHRVAVCRGDQPAARQAVDLVGRHILADKHVEYTGCGLGGGGVDAVDPGVGVRGPDEHRVALVGQRDVIGVLPATGEKAVVFLAADGGANIWQVDEIGCTHVCTPENLERNCLTGLPAARPMAAPEKGSARRFRSPWRQRPAAPP